MEFKQWVERRYRHPVVVVAASVDAENACRRNGMDVINMLRPFSIHQGDLYTRVTDHAEATTVRNFGVRLCRPQCVRRISRSPFRRHMRHLIHNTAVMELGFGEKLDSALSLLLEHRGGTASSPQLTGKMTSTLLECSRGSWQRQFVHDFVHLVRCDHYDTLDHPVGCIFVGSTSTPGGSQGVMEEFKKLKEQRAFKEMFSDMPCMDEDFHSYYLLLHDASTGITLAAAQKMLKELLSTYGYTNCAMVTVNSMSDPQDVKYNDPTLWTDANAPFMDVPSRQDGGIVGGAGVGSSKVVESNAGVGNPNSSTPFANVNLVFGTWPNGKSMVTGCYMNPENINDLRNAMQHYLSQCLFIFIGRKLRSLTATVNERRTTTLGKMAAWFRSKDDMKVKGNSWVIPRQGCPAMYVAESLEMQMRRVADFALFFGDFDMAMHYYRMCRNELLNTLSSRDFNRPLVAACQEGIAICELLQGRLSLPSLTPWKTGGTVTKGNGECRMEVALNDYMLFREEAYALRMAFLLYEYCSTRMPPATERATAVLRHVQSLKIITEDQMCAAVVNELLAADALFVNPPHPAGLVVPATLSDNFAVRSHVRRYAQHCIIAAVAYRAEGLIDSAIRCYLRALRVFHGVGHRGCWSRVYEHIHVGLAEMYSKLGNHARFIAVSSAAVSLGLPMYSSVNAAEGNLNIFLTMQQQALTTLNYDVSPHAAVPCVVEKSFRVAVDPYQCDEATVQQLHKAGSEASEVEWRRMEDKLYSHYSALAVCSPCAAHQWRQDMMRQKRAASAEASGAEAKNMKRHTMHVDGALQVHVTLWNPLGCGITVENLCLLYVSKQSPNQLYRSALTRTVVLDARASVSVAVSFVPSNEGVYVILGFCWVVLGMTGYYYFGTSSACKSGVSQLQGGSCCVDDSAPFEYALNHPSPDVDSPANIEVLVESSKPLVTARLEPEIPLVMRDGEYLHTSLVLTNTSSSCTAYNVTLQRSARSAHLIWFETMGLGQNSDEEATFNVATELPPGGSASLKFTLRACHSYDATSSSRNHIFLLVGYTGATPAQQSYGEVNSAPPLTVTSPRNAGPYMGLHRFMRLVTVRPTLLLSSSTLPSASTRIADAAVVLNVLNASDKQEQSLRIVRVSAVHGPQWSAGLVHSTPLLEGDAVACTMAPGGAVSIPISLLVEAPTNHGAGLPNKSMQPIPILLDDLGAKDSETVQQWKLTEDTCVSLDSVSMSSEARARVISNVGADVSSSAMNIYFMHNSHKGPGGIGEVLSDDGLAFYADKGGAQKQAQGDALDEAMAAPFVLGEPLTPICLAVSWLTNDGSSSGQLFHFFDPVSFVCSREKVVVGEAYESKQEQLSKMLKDNRALHPQHGALLYHVEVPEKVESTLEVPDAAFVPVSVCCRSISAYALLVTIKARDMWVDEESSANKVPFRLSLLSPAAVTFVGRTSSYFIVLPYESHTVQFTACVFQPSVVQCNLFQLNAVALRLPLLPGVSWRSGMSPAAVTAARGRNEPVAPQKRLADSTKGGRQPSMEANEWLQMDGMRDLLCDVQTIVFGYNTAAITSAVFSAFSPEAMRAAAAAAAATTAAMNDDMDRYIEQYKNFAQRRVAAGSENQNTNAVFAVYHPTAQTLTDGTEFLSLI
ncbi:hypothetical protein TRVL_05944 [Trypanosoma vivax]|nr:hypothetical protein TRVL_05944 [Trypanosoma vivax]